MNQTRENLLVKMTDKTIESLASTQGLNRLNGFHPTFSPWIELFGVEHNQPSCPQLYSAGLLFIRQGRKRGLAKGIPFETNKDRYLVLANSYPIDCETITPNESALLGLYIQLDRQELLRQTEILNQFGHLPASDQGSFDILKSLQIDNVMDSLLDSIIAVLHDKTDTEILMPGLISALIYQVLQSDAGPMLNQLTRQNSKLARISNAMRYIESNVSEKIGMDKLALQSGFSGSTFHRAFKEITGESPLQYQKKLRLVKAKNFITHQKQSATEAALAVGYESPAQFSRDFKRYFGVPPSKASELPYSD